MEEGKKRWLVVCTGCWLGLPASLLVHWMVDGLVTWPSIASRRWLDWMDLSPMHTWEVPPGNERATLQCILLHISKVIPYNAP